MEKKLVIIGGGPAGLAAAASARAAGVEDILILEDSEWVLRLYLSESVYS